MATATLSAAGPEGDPAKTTIREFFEGRFNPEWLGPEKTEDCKAYRRAIRRFEVFLEREAMLSDLDRKTCDRFEEWLAANGFAIKSNRSGRCCIVAIWRDAHQNGALEDGPVLSRRKKPAETIRFLATAAKSQPTTLVDFLQRYCVERGLSARSADHLRHVLNNFGKSLNRRPRLSDLKDATVNRWIVWMQEEKLAPETVRRHRIGVVGLWRAAHEAGLVEQLPERIRKVKVPALVPCSWSPRDLVLLLEVAAKVAGRFMRSNIKRSDFWRAWILVAYHSGLRRGDLLKLKPQDIGHGGRMFIVQAKTGNVVQRQLPPEAIEAIKNIFPPARRRIFGDVLSPGRVRSEFSTIIKATRLRGSTKKLRVTGATLCESRVPGSAMSFLGHKTPGLAYRYYVDPRYLQQNSPSAPSIEVDPR